MTTTRIDLLKQCALCGEPLPGKIFDVGFDRVMHQGFAWFVPESPFYPDTDLDKTDPCKCEGRKSAIGA